MPRAIAALLLLLSLHRAAAADAAEEELLVAFEGGYSFLSGEPEDLHGGAGSLSLSYGVTESIWLTGSFGGGREIGGDLRPGLNLFDAFGGVTVALDVFRTIPFLEALVGVVVADLPEETEISPTVRLGAGADYILVPSLSLGAVARWSPVKDEIGGSRVSASLRLVWRHAL